MPLMHRDQDVTDEVKVVAHDVLADDTDLRVLRVRLKERPEPIWLVVFETTVGGEIDEDDVHDRPRRRRIDGRRFDGSVIAAETFPATTAFREDNRSSLSGRNQTRFRDRSRNAAVLRLARTHKECPLHHPTKKSALEHFRRVSRTDHQERDMAKRRMREWSTVDALELPDGRLLTRLRARAPADIDRTFVLLLPMMGSGGRVEILPSSTWQVGATTWFALDGLNDADEVRAAIENGDTRELTNLLMPLSRENGYTDSSAAEGWSDALALLEDALIGSAPPAPVPLVQATPLPNTELPPGVIIISIAVPAVMADDYRRRAEQDVQAYLATTDRADQLPLEDGENIRRRAANPDLLGNYLLFRCPPDARPEKPELYADYDLLDLARQAFAAMVGEELAKGAPNGCEWFLVHRDDRGTDTQLARAWIEGGQLRVAGAYDGAHAQAEDSSASATKQGTPADAEMSRRESALRPLAAKDKPGRRAVEAAAQSLGLSYQQVYRLLDRYRREGADALKPNPGGRPKGLIMVDPEVDALIRAKAAEVRKQATRQSMRSIIAELRARAEALGLRPPAPQTIVARFATFE